MKRVLHGWMGVGLGCWVAAFELSAEPVTSFSGATVEVRGPRLARVEERPDGGILKPERPAFSWSSRGNEVNGITHWQDALRGMIDPATSRAVRGGLCYQLAMEPAEELMPALLQDLVASAERSSGEASGSGLGFTSEAPWAEESLGVREQIFYSLWKVWDGQLARRAARAEYPGFLLGLWAGNTKAAARLMVLPELEKAAKRLKAGDAGRTLILSTLEADVTGEAGSAELRRTGLRVLERLKADAVE